MSKNIADFHLDADKCIGCGRCTKVCPGQLISLNNDHKAVMKDVESFGWDGCWKCQHCIAVCPAGAISIFGKKPEDSLLPVEPAQAAPMLDALIANRRSHRRFLDKNVDRSIIDEMLLSLMNVPSGSNKMQTEYTLVADKDKMDHIRKYAFEKLEELAASGDFPATFDKRSYDQMKEWRQLVRPDMIFCGAPHVLIPHTPGKVGCWNQDPNIAGTYFELLCASRGLGAVMMSFPVNVMRMIPELFDIFEIPHDHYIPMMVGFGYPEINYARGVQKMTLEELSDKVHEV